MRGVLSSKDFLSQFYSLYIRRPINFITLVFLYGTVVGCITTGTVKRDYCNGIDTYREGRLDALDGKTVESFSKKARMCAEYGVTLNQSGYDKGRVAGLKAFCTYEKGYEFGLKARSYRNICPRNKMEPFLKGYKDGDKKCLYEAGHFHALDGKTSSAFSSVKCLQLSKDQSQKEYMKGWKAGLKSFCTYQKGHEFGLKGKKYQNTCPQKRAPSFLKGYRQGDRKCLYEAGYSHAVSGEPSSTFSSVKCLQLSKTQSKKQYMKGWTAGVKVFCTYKEGYRLGLDNVEYQNICPKRLETGFFKGYTLGLQEYKANKRQEELMAVEREKMAVEREKVAVEREKVRAEIRTREELLNLKKLGGRQLCQYDSDCGKNGDCRYNFQIEKDVCYYD